MSYDYLERPLHGGIQRLYRFPNGYGASLVKTQFSYGGEDDLWELAVIKYNDKHYNLTFGTSVTDDVIGYLTTEEAESYLPKIEALTNYEILS